MPPADAPGFCKEICRFQRPKSGAANAKVKRTLSFAIIERLIKVPPKISGQMDHYRLDKPCQASRKSCLKSADL